MKIIESRQTRLRRTLRQLIPVAGIILVVVVFLLAVNAASDSSLSSQKASLERALAGGAIRTYALTGCYPESLDELLETYHITYNKNKYIVEYVPQGANLVPSIFVIPLGQKR